MKLCIRGSILRCVFPMSDRGLNRTGSGPYPNWLHCQASSPSTTGPSCVTQASTVLPHQPFQSCFLLHPLGCIQPVSQTCPKLSFFYSFPGLCPFLSFTVKILLISTPFPSGRVSGFLQLPVPVTVPFVPFLK